MRQTLHIIPSDEFPLYIAAQRPSRVAQGLRVMARFGIEAEEADATTNSSSRHCLPGLCVGLKY